MEISFPREALQGLHSCLLSMTYRLNGNKRKNKRQVERAPSESFRVRVSSYQTHAFHVPMERSVIESGNAYQGDGRTTYTGAREVKE